MSASSSIPKFYVKPYTSIGDLTATRELFTAYAEALDIDLSFQNFTAELSSLPGLYAPPAGAILLAFASKGDEAIGCIGLRPLKVTTTETASRSESSETTKKVCEMKRLYCIPAARGSGVGRALVEAIIQEAIRLGYDEIKLDTLSTMVGPRKLYASVGFVEVEAYYKTPLEGTIFLSKKLYP